MIVKAWSNGSGTYGLRVGLANRNKWFKKRWTAIDVDLDGKSHRFNLTAGFWNKCPEIRDSGHTAIKDWLCRHRNLNWPRGSPPTMELTPLSEGKFRLLA
jgi:hypothetical protein